MARSSFFSRFSNWLQEWDETKTRQVLIVLLGVLAGLLLGMLVYTIAKYALDQMFPFPPGLYMIQGAEKEALLKTVAVQVFVSIPLTWAIGAFVGGYCAARMGNIGQFPAWISGILLTAYFWLDMLQMPSNTVLYVLCPVLVGVFSVFGGRLGMYVSAKRRLSAEA